MNVITRKVRLVASPEPPVPPLEDGTEISIRTTATETVWAVKLMTLADGETQIDVDCGDGTTATFLRGENFSHLYREPGDYRVRFPDRLRFLSPSYRMDDEHSTIYAPMIRTVRSVATRLSSLGIGSYRNCRNMTVFDMTAVPMPEVNAAALEGCTSLQALSGLPRTAAILGNKCFQNCRALNGRIDLPGIRTVSAVESRQAPFAGCPGITELHFARDAESSLRANPLCTTAFGAENAVVFFDL